ncbi:MAG TPA: 3-(methylthio)propionyl-CoA ligase [Aliidongia sp.]|uniref:3-(methylthio)propionyl-CoA ligase n=1 Tax=Aliidongia sp. TaxID=1914230 RepID=UPI002DDD80C0|nr:3-(methylthio)propionyl-CoA ligase [Aliidongia sp.]HEV2673745.1 3-(methylthio)propionyl-CoA ligase [Aliidongia sp.]
MLGMMMDQPLLISSLIEHAARFHGDTEIVSREADRSVFRYDYAAAADRAKQIGQAIARLGAEPGDRIGTLAWNSHRHFELYYGISGTGRVLHTINPRLFPDQLRYIINHAADRILFIEPSFVGLVEKLAPLLTTVRHYVIMAPKALMPDTSLPNALCYEELIDAESAEFEWPRFDEQSASSLCYTSGTTGNPKGALYTHRSTLLHAFAACAADMLGIGAADSVLPVVPMFHVNAWGIPYSCPLAGAKLVLPGPYLDGESLCTLFEQERVTFSLGVPTIWLGALKYAEETGKGFSSVKRVVVGGSAAPPSMIEAFDKKHGIRALHAWGMTEMSPLGTAATLKSKHATAAPEEITRVLCSQGRPSFMVDLKITGEDGQRLPHDGVAIGNLYVRGPWVVSGYYNDEAASAEAFDAEGWFKTGDVCAIDPDGYVRITDRSKDVIKSGGEWISSIDLENAAVGHPDVAEAAVIGLPHPRWDERPLLILVPKPGRTIDKAAMMSFLADRVAKWWLPDDIALVDQLPHTATGKLLKTQLRQDFADYKLPTA